MRRSLILPILAAGLLLAGWGHEGPRVKVGLLLDDTQEKKAFLDRFRSELGSLKADLLMASSAKDPLRNVSDLIDQGAQALVVFYDDPKGLKGLMARAKGVPVLSVGRPLPDAGQAFLITYDPGKEGELQAQGALSAAPRGSYHLVGPLGKDWFSRTFREGQLKVLRPALKEGLVKIEENARPRSEANAWLVADPAKVGRIRMEVLIQQWSGKKIICGIGEDLEDCRAILTGHQETTVYRSPLKLAEESAYLATKAARSAKTFDCQFADVPTGLDTVKTVLLTPKLLDRSNLSETLVKDGVFTKEELEGKAK